MAECTRSGRNTGPAHIVLPQKYLEAAAGIDRHDIERDAADGVLDIEPDDYEDDRALVQAATTEYRQAATAEYLSTFSTIEDLANEYQHAARSDRSNQSSGGRQDRLVKDAVSPVQGVLTYEAAILVETYYDPDPNVATRTYVQAVNSLDTSDGGTTPRGISESLDDTITINDNEERPRLGSFPGVNYRFLEEDSEPAATGGDEEPDTESRQMPTVADEVVHTVLSILGGKQNVTHAPANPDNCF